MKAAIAQALYDGHNSFQAGAHPVDLSEELAYVNGTEAASHRPNNLDPLDTCQVCDTVTPGRPPTGACRQLAADYAAGVVATWIDDQGW